MTVANPISTEQTDRQTPRADVVTRTLDCRGMICPLPIYKTSRELSSMVAGEARWPRARWTPIAWAPAIEILPRATKRARWLKAMELRAPSHAQWEGGGFPIRNAELVGSCSLERGVLDALSRVAAAGQAVGGHDVLREAIADEQVAHVLVSSSAAARTRRSLERDAPESIVFHTLDLSKDPDRGSTRGNRCERQQCRNHQHTMDDLYRGVAVHHFSPTRGDNRRNYSLSDSPLCRERIHSVPLLRHKSYAETLYIP